MSGREAGGDGGDARPSAGEHLPLVGEFCIYRDRLGKESNVKMIARDLNFVPPSCAIACYRDGKEKQQVATIKQEWFGRIRPLPLPLSAERQRNLLLSLPEVFDTCEGEAHASSLLIQLAPCFRAACGQPLRVM